MQALTGLRFVAIAYVVSTMSLGAALGAARDRPLSRRCAGAAAVAPLARALRRGQLRALSILRHPIYDAIVTWIDADWQQAPLYLVQAYAIMIPIAVLSFERFEQPLRTWLLRRIRIASIRWRYSLARR